MVIKQSDSLVERLFPAGKHCSQADRAENGVEKPAPPSLPAQKLQGIERIVIWYLLYKLSRIIASISVVFAEISSQFHPNAPSKSAAVASRSPQGTHNLSAGNFCSCVAGGLRGEIIGIPMDDYRFPDNFIDGKVIRQKHLKGIAVISQNRQQISGMVGMVAVIGIIMRLRICKGIVRIADASAVNMKREKLIPACSLRSWKSGDLHGNKHADCGLEKGNVSGNHRKFRASLDPCARGGRPTKNLGKVRKLMKKQRILYRHFNRPFHAIIL